MTPAFESAFRFTVIGQEGGFVLSTLKFDSGGQTYAGISRVNFPEWAGWKLIDAGDTKSDQLHDLVYSFYWSSFWQRMGLERLPSRIATLVFDFAVNSGRDIAAKKLQQVLRVTVDGDIGPQTSLAAYRADWRAPVIYLNRRLDYLNDLKAWDNFGRGWSQRIVNLFDFAAAA